MKIAPLFFWGSVFDIYVPGTEDALRNSQQISLMKYSNPNPNQISLMKYNVQCSLQGPGSEMNQTDKNLYFSV